MKKRFLGGKKLSNGLKACLKWIRHCFCNRLQSNYRNKEGKEGIMVRILDVAKKANVSTATVSRVLTNLKQ